MSRRDSRVSMHVRQNDALFEFESFKKKFLLANKHITKLNSTLSVRIEELNAQISTLYVENLRLRASEIALGAQLKKEREKSRKVMADAEAASLNLTKHLGFLRHAFKISSSASPPPSPPPPRARRPVIDPVVSPQAPRLSRPPNVPGINEEEEDFVDSADEDQEAEQEKQPSPVRRKSKLKPRLSASRLPLPSRVSPPPPLPALDTSAPFHIDLPGLTDASTSRKPSRRQSGLLNPGGSRVGVRGELCPPRPASPAIGLPIRREAAMEEEEEEIAVETALTVRGMVDAEDDDDTEGTGRENRKGKERETDSRADTGRTRERDRKRSKEEEDSSSTTEGSKLKLKDVTNSPRSRANLPPLDTNVGAANRDRHQTPESDAPTSAMTATSTFTVRTFLSTPATTPVQYPPTPQASSSPIPPAETDGPAGGRERRARKSVNYAEPKLNTKMRKPDPMPDMPIATTKKQLSPTASNYMPTYSEVDGGDEAGRSSLEREGTPVNGLVGTSPPPSTHLQALSTVSHVSAAVTTVRRKQSRPYLIPDDNDSDGAQADVDIEGGRTIGWVNVEGRRRSGSQNVRKVIRVVERRVEDDDGRRHSMAV